MALSEPPKPYLARAANTALCCGIAAFGLDKSRLTLSLETGCDGGVEILLRYRMDGGGDHFLQRRALSAQHWSAVWAAADLRTTVDEMMMNIALAFRSAPAKAPTGWSIHPVAASVIAAAKTELPNPADPLNWFGRARREIHLPNGGHIADAIFTGRQGVLLLKSAKILDARGATIATLGMKGLRMMVHLPGGYPEVFGDSLKGRPAEALCEMFAADPRGAVVPINSAECTLTDPPIMVVELADRLVPLLPGIPGDEPWRPKNAIEVVRPPLYAQYRRYLRHPTLSLRRCYARAAASRQARSP